METKRPLKRSQRVVLTTLTVAGVATVQACGSADWSDEPTVDAMPFASVAECESSGQVPAAECQTAFAEAQANHEQAAPRFETEALCEEQFGDGQCQPRIAGNSNYFIPILGGFMVARMLDRDRPYYRYGGLYRSRRNNLWYSGGAYGAPLQSTGSGWRAGASGLERPTSSPPVRSRSSTVSRGGFGGRARGGGG